MSVEVAKLCRLMGCTDKHYAKGLCRSHYMRGKSRTKNYGLYT